MKSHIPLANTYNGFAFERRSRPIDVTGEAPSMSIPPAPVLILGAGVNGICVARELVLNRVPVWIVDTHDIAFGATAKSSRLIHGGLRSSRIRRLQTRRRIAA